MRAAVLAIGDELVSGYRLDTNSQIITQGLQRLGIDVVLHVSVGDDAGDIDAALDTALEAADVVVITGGLGPTEDDLTRQSVAAYFGLPLVENEAALERIRQRFALRNIPMPESNRSQAMVPDGSEILQNDWGTAPGFYVQQRGRHVFAVPGVPYEMRAMLEQRVLPRLAPLSHGNVVRRMAVVKLFGLSESAINERVRPMLARERNPRLGLLPHWGLITVEIVARAASAEEAEALATQDVQALRQEFGRHVVCEDERELPDVVADLLAQQCTTVALVEIGTGGMLSDWLSDLPQADVWVRHSEVLPAPASPADPTGLAEEARQAHHTDLALAVAGLQASDEGGWKAGSSAVAALAGAGGTATRHITVPGARAEAKHWLAQRTLDWLRRTLLDLPNR